MWEKNKNFLGLSLNSILLVIVIVVVFVALAVVSHHFYQNHQYQSVII